MIAGGAGGRKLQGLASFRGIPFNGVDESPSVSQERRSSGVTASTSYAASEANPSVFTDDTAMGTGVPA